MGHTHKHLQLHACACARRLHAETPAVQLCKGLGCPLNPLTPLVDHDPTATGDMATPGRLQQKRELGQEWALARNIWSAHNNPCLCLHTPTHPIKYSCIVHTYQYSYRAGTDPMLQLHCCALTPPSASNSSKPCSPALCLAGWQPLLKATAINSMVLGWNANRVQGPLTDVTHALP